MGETCNPSHYKKIPYSAATEIFQGCAGNYTPVDWSNENLRETNWMKVDRCAKTPFYETYCC
jgi:hypothetical protein